MKATIYSVASTVARQRNRNLARQLLFERPKAVALILQTKHKHANKLHKICQFGQFIFVKIINIAAIRSHLLELNTPNSISAGAPPQTPLGKLNASPGPLVGFYGSYF